MKYCLSAICSALVLTSCAGVRISDTQVASGAVKPRAIYIRPFDVAATEFTGHHSGFHGERPIRQSLAGREMADALKASLERLAPAMVIEENESATTGWVVTGSLDVVDAGDIVIHLFRPEVRSFYNLERMWAFGDAGAA